ncbi:MAG TPA: hypothetical protein VK750_09280, partial [Cytophagaceae bacterium]|nr:hypothetical protein [Cytophagaceae bacterium]
QPDSWRFTPTYMELLSEIRAKFCKGIRLKLNTQKLTSQLVAQLEETFTANKGTCNLYFQIIDAEERISTESFSRKYKIDPNNSLLNALSEMEDVEYKILS